MWNFNKNKKWADNVNERINTKNEQTKEEKNNTLHTSHCRSEQNNEGQMDLLFN